MILVAQGGRGRVEWVQHFQHLHDARSPEPVDQRRADRDQPGQDVGEHNAVAGAAGIGGDGQGQAARAPGDRKGQEQADGDARRVQAKQPRQQRQRRHKCRQQETEARHPAYESPGHDLQSVQSARQQHGERATRLLRGEDSPQNGGPSHGGGEDRQLHQLPQGALNQPPGLVMLVQLLEQIPEVRGPRDDRPGQARDHRANPKEPLPRGAPAALDAGQRTGEQLDELGHVAAVAWAGGIADWACIASTTRGRVNSVNDTIG
jgi:hypothetical protein